MSATSKPRLGLAITTIGRPALTELLRSAAESSLPPSAVSIANQSGRALDIDPRHYPFPVTLRPSTGGASAGRNDAINALPDNIDIVGFPNDDSFYPRTALEAVVDRFASHKRPAAIACSSRAGVTYSRDLPPTGTELDRYTVWRAIEWAMFVERATLVASGGFRTDLGTGSPSPWQSGEGTDLLLRLMARGLPIVSAPEIEILGPGERRDLTADAFVAKHRKYARGTGYVYRTHPYPMHVRLRILVAPWLRLRSLDPSLPLACRIAIARSFGRLEGLLNHPFGATAQATSRQRHT